MDKENSDYEDYLKMLGEEEEDERLDQLLFANYGDSGSEYEPNDGEISDSDIENFTEYRKRKRNGVSIESAAKRSVSESSDSSQSTSTTGGFSTDTNTEPLEPTQKSKGLSKSEIG